MTEKTAQGLSTPASEVLKSLVAWIPLQEQFHRGLNFQHLCSLSRSLSLHLKAKGWMGLQYMGDAWIFGSLVSSALLRAS